MKRGSIMFICRKCEHTAIIEYTDAMSATELAGKLEYLSNAYCPVCGEESYMNWILDNVEI